MAPELVAEHFQPITPLANFDIIFDWDQDNDLTNNDSITTFMNGATVGTYAVAKAVSPVSRPGGRVQPRSATCFPLGNLHHPS